MTRKVDLLFTNAIVLTMDSKLNQYDPGAVAVAGDGILAVGPEAEITKASCVIAPSRFGIGPQFPVSSHAICFGTVPVVLAVQKPDDFPQPHPFGRHF